MALITEASLQGEILDPYGLSIFYGDLHNHTGYSDGTGTPAEALKQMRARGLHFGAITEHGEFFDREITSHDYDRWAAIAATVEACSSSDDFIGIRGFEWTSPQQGHVNVWWSADYTGYLRTGGESIDDLYRWLEKATGIGREYEVFAGFNHPGRETGCFDGYRYIPALDNRIVTTECFNKADDYGEEYFRTLDQGWHVGAVGAADHHGDDWGGARLPRTGVLADRLTLPNLQQAFRQRHIYATRSATLKLVLIGNAQLMGARLALPSDEVLTLDVWCDDSSLDSSSVSVELWTNGSRLVDAINEKSARSLKCRVEVKPQESGEHWFVARVLHDGAPLAYSSPVWARWQS